MSDLKPIKDIKCTDIKPLPKTTTKPSNYVDVSATLIDSKGFKYGPINISVDPDYLNSLPKISK